MFWQNGGKYTTDRAPGLQLQLQTHSLIETGGEETSSEKKQVHTVTTKRYMTPKTNTKTLKSYPWNTTLSL